MVRFHHPWSFPIPRLLVVMSLAVVLSTPGVRAENPAPDTRTHTFGVQRDHFALNGKPFQIISGEMHYPRIPRAYWRQELRLAKAMGLNTITTYTFWNLHEPKPGVFDFSGQNDVGEFIREAQQEGLYVLLRPGPYICAEWEWGGYPAWLLRNKGIVVRSLDPVFMRAAGDYLKRLGQELAPLQIGNGGPIIGVQVENEYGSYGSDHAYMEAVKQQILDAGFTQAMLYTADGAELLEKGSLPELPAAINFGTGEARHSFELLKQARPTGPLICGEYWAGWFDHWGARHQTTDAAKQAEELEWMLRQGFSVSLYLVHGGTTFGWMNGANIDNGRYEPDVTSYDYDAAIDESGRPTAKYTQFLDAIARATGNVPPAVPQIPGVQGVAPFRLEESSPLFDELPAAVSSSEPMTMEALGQAYGYVLYRTMISRSVAGTLQLRGLHDYAKVYANGKLLGSLDRREGTESLNVDLAGGTRLDVLVENTGRVNYGPALPGENVGLIGGVTLDGRALRGWQQFSMPMQHPDERKYSRRRCVGPCFYKGTFSTNSQQDMFLNTENVSKGFVWVNGIALGRVWSIGPQKTLYLPGVWLHRGRNEVVVLDLEGKGPPKLVSELHPLLDKSD
jgi:beta-galactosidase